MKSNFGIRDKTIAEQVSSMRSRYPQFATNFTSGSSMKVTGMLQPTSRSDVYQFVLKYNLTEPPKIKILSPVLMKNDKGKDVPHIYPGENLCLYRPKYHEFTSKEFISETIIPWTSLWLYYYEVWHLTDDWLGGGEHPTIPLNAK